MKKPLFIAGVAVLLLLAVLLTLATRELLAQQARLNGLRGKVSEITAPILNEILPAVQDAIGPSATQSPSQDAIHKPVKETIPNEPMPQVEYPGGEDLDDYGDWLPQHEQSEAPQSPSYREETLVVPKVREDGV